MRISRVKISNFANFSDIDVETGESIVIVGENKVGKSNFVRALQLILDPGLSERDRQLGLEQFWDGLGEDKLGETIEVAVELTDFAGDPRLMAHLNDCVVDLGPPMVARPTYRFQPKANLGRDPESLADYEYIIFGGDDPEMSIGPSLMRMLPLDVQVALRDAAIQASRRPTIRRATAWCGPGLAAARPRLWCSSSRGSWRRTCARRAVRRASPTAKNARAN